MPLTEVRIAEHLAHCDCSQREVGVAMRVVEQHRRSLALMRDLGMRVAFVGEVLFVLKSDGSVDDTYPMPCPGCRSLTQEVLDEFYGRPN